MKADREVLQNLSDAGCDEETISRFEALSGRDDTPAQQKLLYAYRKELVDAVHADQSKLSCLDYLIYRMQKT